MIDRFRGKYRFLSSFWPVLVWLENCEYPSVEHAYQAAKTTDPAQRRLIRNADTPGRAKRLGRKVTMRKGWDYMKRDVMDALIRQKFKHRELRKLLLETGKQTLVEGNSWHDNYWGVCDCSKCQGKGQNTLGKLLMEERKRIRENVPGKLGVEWRRN